MRKVIYQVWLMPEQSASGKMELSDKLVGFFHGWGNSAEHSGDNMCSVTVGIVED